MFGICPQQRSLNVPLMLSLCWWLAQQAICFLLGVLYHPYTPFVLVGLLLATIWYRALIWRFLMACLMACLRWLLRRLLWGVVSSCVFTCFTWLLLSFMSCGVQQQMSSSWLSFLLRLSAWLLSWLPWSLDHWMPLTEAVDMSTCMQAAAVGALSVARGALSAMCGRLFALW